MESIYIYIYIYIYIVESGEYIVESIEYNYIEYIDSGTGGVSRFILAEIVARGMRLRCMTLLLLTPNS